MDIFEPKTMLEAVEQMKRPQSFFLDRYFGGTPRRFPGKSVEFDIRRGKRRLAPFTNPQSEGQTVDRIGYKRIQFEPGYLKPKMQTTAEDILNNTSFGSHEYADFDPDAEAAMQLGEDFAELDSMITRREEWMALRILQHGTLRIQGEGVDRTVDFDFDPDHKETLTGTDAWDDPDSDPIRDLLMWRLMVLRDYGRAPQDCILGNDAAFAFLNHPKVKDWFNRWNFFVGKLDVNIAENVLNLGYVQMLGMTLFSVNEWFIDPIDGQEREMLDGNRVMLISRGFRARRLYGAIHVVDSMAPVPRFPKSWVTQDPSARWIQLHSAPLPAVMEPDAIFTATVLEEEE